MHSAKVIRPGQGDGNDPDFFVSSLYISVAIKVRVLKLHMFSRYEIYYIHTGIIIILDSKFWISHSLVDVAKN